MPSQRPGEVWVDGVRVECRKGHKIEGENLVRWLAPDGTERRACRECRRFASKAGGEARASDRVLAKRRRDAGDLPRPAKPWLTAFTHNPGLLAECRDLYEGALARERALHTRAAIGRRGGRPRQGKTAGRPVPVTIITRQAT